MMPLNPILIVKIFDVWGIDHGTFPKLLWLSVHISCCGLCVQVGGGCCMQDQ
jgi:hypothetical protein